jgi:hypothetical protein
LDFFHLEPCFFFCFLLKKKNKIQNTVPSSGPGCSAFYLPWVYPLGESVVALPACWRGMPEWVVIRACMHGEPGTCVIPAHPRTPKAPTISPWTPVPRCAEKLVKSWSMIEIYIHLWIICTIIGEFTFCFSIQPQGFESTCRPWSNKRANLP